jgi:beta-glucosidase
MIHVVRRDILGTGSLCALLHFSGPAYAASAPTSAPLYKDANQPVERRVDDLLGRMTLDEKVAQLRTLWTAKAELFDARGHLDPAKMAQLFPDGIGGYSRPSDVKGPVSPRVLPFHDARETVAIVNELQRYALTHTRLGIPILFHEEGLHGYATRGTTSFPVPIALASSFDPDLVTRVNAVTAREMSARGVSLALTPVVDVARDPRWGRIEETFGEDPYLVGRLGVAAINGLQGPGHSRVLTPDHVFATLKHLTGHGQPQSGTNVGPAPISERELREYFFPPFQRAIAETGVNAVMASYNEIDGVPSHANRWLLHDVLRGEWGFQGAVVSDYYGIDQLESIHRIAANPAQAARLALSAGVDADLPEGACYATLTGQVREGAVPEKAIDEAARKVLELKFRAGLFERTYADADRAVNVTNTADAIALSREAAARSIVLLKNDGTLPLKLPTADGARKPVIAVIGPDAATPHLGGYYGVPPHPVSFLEGIKGRAGNRATIVYAEGVKITKNDDWWADEVQLADPAENAKLIEQAVTVAKDADQIVLNFGGNEQTSREGWADTHLGDRSTLDLIGQQQDLFDALRKLGKPITVVLTNGGPLAVVKVAEQANALIESWYLGEQGGNAIAQVLFGDVNPGGKLPVTIPRNVGQVPSYYDHKPSALRGYLFDTTKPLYPFGFGLSYTTFSLSEPRLSTNRIRKGGSVQVTVTVRNTGARGGDEVVQLYLHQKVASVTQPVEKLVGFERVSLDAAAERAVTFTLTADQLAIWNIDMQHVVEPGEFELMAGANSAEFKTATLTVTP